MSDFEYSPSCSPTFIRENLSLWSDESDIDTDTETETETEHFNSKILTSLVIKGENENENENEEYIKLLEQKIIDQQKQINNQKKSIKQLTDIYFEFNSILTLLWEKTFNIEIIKTRKDIIEILNIWYHKEWIDKQ